MKRRNFLQWLSVSPIGIGAFRKKAEEAPKPVEPPKPAPQVRQTLGPQTGEYLTACSVVVQIPPDWLK